MSWLFSLRQFGLRTLLVVMLAVALVTGWYANRYRQMRRAGDLVKEHHGWFTAGEGSRPWYDRLPFLDPPPYLGELSVTSSTDVEAVVPAVRDLGTVRSLRMYSLTTRDVELIRQIDSIRVVEADWGLTTEQLRLLLSLPLEQFSVSGPNVNIPHDQLELLLSLPTIQRIGMADGESGVPPELRAKRPDVSYFITDFPP